MHCLTGTSSSVSAVSGQASIGWQYTLAVVGHAALDFSSIPPSIGRRKR